jgi:2-dehydro-3-deoxyglucarate aldolase
MLKNKLKKNELTIGSWIMMGNSTSVEVMATAGFDWLAIDLEHTSIDLETAQNLIQIIQSKNVKALVRVSKNEEVIIKKVLDMGADGIIVPMISSKNDAIQAINYSKYPPQGKRGVGLSRATGYGIDFEKYKKWVNKELVIIAQIEHIDAVKNIDQIITVDGIDGVIIGPYDLSASMGYPGKFDNNRFKTAIQKVVDSCKAHKVSSGLHVVSTDPKIIQTKIKQGYTFLAYGIDYMFMRDAALNGIKKLKK